MNGLNGPFGSVGTISAKFLQTFYKNDDKQRLTVWKAMPPFLLPSINEFAFMQNDSVNCGICILLFMIDLVASQSDKSWEVPPNDASPFSNSIKMGTTFFDSEVMTEQYKQLPYSDIYRNHCLLLYHVFREEIVVLMERLRFLYLETIQDLHSIEIKEGWGEIGDKLKQLHKQLEGHINTARTPDQHNWASKVKKMKDNVYRKALQDVTIHENASGAISFCYAGRDRVNDTLGILVESERDLEMIIYDMYAELLNQDVSKVSGIYVRWLLQFH